VSRVSAAAAAARRGRSAALAALVALACGCATMPPPARQPAPPAASTPTPPGPAAPGPGGQVGTTASGGSITINHRPPMAAVVDSTPSEDALAVLHTIPEPLGGSRAEGAPADTAGVPVPAPTQPLGERPIEALPESLAAPAARPPAASAPAAGAAAPAAVPADSCWRVQVKAPPERERAARLVEAASSQLLVPFVIEREGGLYKVRTRDCLTAVAANDLRRRAEEVGFAGAFRFRAKPR
jgi:hypothetical protein